jgi:hypothetical protein
MFSGKKLRETPIAATASSGKLRRASGNPPCAVSPLKQQSQYHRKKLKIMKAKVLCLLLGVALMALPGTASAKEIVLPAGTLMTCTLDEPNFSSATVTVGDPFLCHPRAMQMFGQSVFPRGAYLVGHLQADKDPGHFVGKGYLQLSFDRIGLADTDLPISAKIIAVRGYRVDREGKIIGHGHATRDVVEWMLPPLWPWKVLTLPARGPRPTLKGEVAVTLRLMEDVTVPSGNSPNRFGEPGAGLARPPRVFSSPTSPSSFLDPDARPLANGGATPLFQFAELPNAAAKPLEVVAPAPVSDHSGWQRFGEPRATLFATKQGTVYVVTQYRRNSDTLAFILTSGALVTLDLRDLDWPTTTQLNSERGVRINLRNGPICNGDCAGN